MHWNSLILGNKGPNYLNGEQRPSESRATQGLTCLGTLPVLSGPQGTGPLSGGSPGRILMATCWLGERGEKGRKCWQAAGLCFSFTMPFIRCPSRWVIWGDLGHGGSPTAGERQRGAWPLTPGGWVLESERQINRPVWTVETVFCVKSRWNSPICWHRNTCPNISPKQSDG